jgi:hypothetical protein
VVYDAWAAPVTSLDEATDVAELVVYGKVVRTEFSVPTDGELPLATSTIRVMRTGKGEAPGEIVVRQVGGPILWANDGEGGLAYLSTDELVLAGDEVILSVFHDGVAYTTVPGRGVYFVRNGTVATATSNPGVELNGLSADEALARIRDIANR